MSDRRIRDVLRKVGMPLRRNYSVDSYRVQHVWDGVGLAFKLTAEPLHELAHWQICGPRRRLFPEYGLGPSPDTSCSVDFFIDKKLSSTEEAHASVLGVMWERHLGIGNYRSRLEDHGWNDLLGTHSLVEVIANLVYTSYIDSTLKPTYKVGTKPLLAIKGLKE